MDSTCPSGASELDRCANLLGALALVLADRTVDGIQVAVGQSGTAATALAALHHLLDRPSIDRLRQVLGLTSSGTVRLVDRLADAGYVERQLGDDGRSSHVVLTPAGRAAAVRVCAARADVLRHALDPLDAHDRQALEDLVARMLVGLMRGPGAQRWMCRLCDTGACGRDAGLCPVANTAWERYGA